MLQLMIRLLLQLPPRNRIHFSLLLNLAFVLLVLMHIILPSFALLVLMHIILPSFVLLVLMQILLPSFVLLVLMQILLPSFVLLVLMQILLPSSIGARERYWAAIIIKAVVT